MLTGVNTTMKSFGGDRCRIQISPTQHSDPFVTGWHYPMVTSLQT